MRDSNKAVQIMAIKLSNIRSKVEQAITYLQKYNGPVVQRLFPKLSAIISLLEDVLKIISEKPKNDIPE